MSKEDKTNPTNKTPLIASSRATPTYGSFAKKLSKNVDEAKPTSTHTLSSTSTTTEKSSYRSNSTRKHCHYINYCHLFLLIMAGFGPWFIASAINRRDDIANQKYTLNQQSSNMRDCSNRWNFDFGLLCTPEATTGSHGTNTFGEWCSKICHEWTFGGLEILFGIILLIASVTCLTTICYKQHSRRSQNRSDSIVELFTIKEERIPTDPGNSSSDDDSLSPE